MTIQLPKRLPHITWLTFLWGVYLAIWILYESGLWLTVWGAVLSAILLVGYLFNRFLAGRTLPIISWLLLSAFTGAFAGLGCALLTLFFMVIKTGLHAHGPEFSAAEVNWILQQIPLWIFVGLLVGLGVGFLIKAGSTAVD